MEKNENIFLRFLQNVTVASLYFYFKFILQIRNAKAEKHHERKIIRCLFSHEGD